MKMDLRYVKTLKWAENGIPGMCKGAVWRKTAEELEKGDVRVSAGRHSV